MIRRRAAAFLDRDGTINVEMNYLHRVSDVELIPGVGLAIRRLNQAGLAVVVVTNQAGIARGYYDARAVAMVHDQISRLLQVDAAYVDAFYFCPHHPEFTGVCACRKPLPGMLIQAANDLDLDLKQSWMVGDMVGDVEAGLAAGCRTILVRTGYGAQSTYDLVSRPHSVTAIVPNLPIACDVMLKRAK